MAMIADLLRFARRQDTLYGEMDTFSRVLGNGVESGRVRYRLQGVSDTPGVFGVNLNIEGEFAVTCQRCLEPLRWPVCIKKFFRLVQESGFREAYSDDELNSEDFDLLLMGKPLDVESLVEEMLVLEWPVSPKHDDCALFIQSSSS